MKNKLAPQKWKQNVKKYLKTHTHRFFLMCKWSTVFRQHYMLHPRRRIMKLELTCNSSPTMQYPTSTPPAASHMRNKWWQPCCWALHVICLMRRPAWNAFLHNFSIHQPPLRFTASTLRNDITSRRSRLHIDVGCAFCLQIGKPAPPSPTKDRKNSMGSPLRGQGSPIRRVSRVERRYDYPLHACGFT